jgi:hypothetical protein
MQQDKIKVAEYEAKRFLEIVNMLMAEPNRGDLLYGSRMSGAVRRSSLDLTRALAEMRKP